MRRAPRKRRCGGIERVIDGDAETTGRGGLRARLLFGASGIGAASDDMSSTRGDRDPAEVRTARQSTTKPSTIHLANHRNSEAEHLCGLSKKKIGIDNRAHSRVIGYPRSRAADTEMPFWPTEAPGVTQPDAAQATKCRGRRKRDGGHG